MIRNFIPCCRKCSNERLYLQVSNLTTFYIFFTLQYKINNKYTNKTTPVFKPGKREHLLFSSEAIEKSFKIYNASQLPPTLILRSNLPKPERYCYELIGNSEQVECCRVTC